jgi:hypothetical protein
MALFARGSFFYFNVIRGDTESAPKGIRTPVLALRGPRPGPLDDGGKPIAPGVWSRRLTQEHRIVYLVRDDRIDFLQAWYHY